MPIEIIHPFSTFQKDYDKIKVNYSGETVRGVPHGLGEFTWFEEEGG